MHNDQEKISSAEFYFHDLTDREFGMLRDCVMHPGFSVFLGFWEARRKDVVEESLGNPECSELVPFIRASQDYLITDSIAEMPGLVEEIAASRERDRSGGPDEPTSRSDQ